MSERGIEAGLFAEELREVIRKKRKKIKKEILAGKSPGAMTLLAQIEEEIDKIEEKYQNA